MFPTPIFNSYPSTNKLWYAPISKQFGASKLECLDFPNPHVFTTPINHLTKSFKAHEKSKYIIMSKIIYTSLDASIRIFIFKSAMSISFSLRFYTQIFQEFHMLVLKGNRLPSMVILKLKDKDG